MEISQQSQEKRDRLRLKREINHGRLAMLAVLAVSVINLLMLLFHINYHFLFAAAAPYYLIWMAGTLGRMVFPAILAGLLILAVYGVCWYLSIRQSLWLRVAFGLYCLDTLFLVIFAFTALENPASCLFEIITHLPVLWFLCQSIVAAEKLKQLRRPRRPRPEPVQDM